MKAKYLTLLLACLFAGSSSFAASSLKAVMRNWKGDGATARAMAGGQMPPNDTEMRRILNRFISDSKELEARTSSGAAAKDIRARFARFEADSSAALAVAGDKQAIKVAIGAVIGNCKSCHDAYAN